MANVVSITGVSQVLRNLHLREAALEAGCQRGLKLAGVALQRASMRLVPVNFGILKNSAFVRSAGAGLKTQVTVGYTAAYAIYVHENIEMKLRGLPRVGGKGSYWDPAGRGQSKFLEAPARSMKAALRKTILDEMEIV